LINFSVLRENEPNGVCGLLEWAAEHGQQMGAGSQGASLKLLSLVEKKGLEIVA
jgi:hypothetical protein